MELLATKFYMPPLRPNLVLRPHLLQQLDDGLRHGRSLTLVAAPAGYGKTTLVAAWLKHIAEQQSSDRRPWRAWLSLDEDDNDLTRFLTYLVAALRESGVHLGDEDRRLWEMSPLPPVEALVTSLLNEIRGYVNGRSLLLVLDDYHKIQTPRIHNALQFLVNYAPPGLHLVLVTREDPPLTLSRWRVGNQLTEIRAADLRFRLAETADFLNETMGLALTPEDIAALERRTEGWVAGLQLAAIALQSPHPGDDHAAAEFIAAFSGSHHYVIDYLVEEVLRQQDADVRAFLRATAVLNRLNASLCDAVMGRDDSQEILAYLERRNLFLVPLDSHRHWFRYHHLLADSLRAGIDAAARTRSHRRAAAWFAEQRLYAEAIDHAAAAEDTDEVARLVRLAADPAFRRGEIVQIAAWLERLPIEQVIGDPEFGIYRVLSLILTGRSHEAPAAIAALEEHSAGWQDERQRARLLVLKAWMADITASDERVARVQDAADALGDDDPLFSAFVAVPLGHAHMAQGRLPEAVEAFRAGLAQTQRQGTAFVRLSLLGNLVHALNFNGRRRQAWAVCEDAIAGYVDAQGEPLPPAGIPYLLRAWLRYEANQLEAARADAARGEELLRAAFDDTLLTPLQVELPAWLHEDAGDTTLALEAARAGRARAERQKYHAAARAVARLEAELQLRHGQLAAVRAWVDGTPIFQDRSGDGRWHHVDPSRDLAYLTYARFLLADARTDEARTLLPLLLASIREGGRGRSRISACLLQAVVADEPLPYLLEALQLAAAEQYRRLFVDECAFPAHGPHLAQLLTDSAVRAAAPAFVDAVLTAVPTENVTLPPAAGTAEAAASLAEPLTEQELVVLGLLVSGLTNREIAEQLVITVGTAKWHVHNIYQKLNVGSRAEAIVRAHELSLVEL